MIRPQSLLRVIDNSGAKLVKCIKVKNKGGQSYANIGDIVVVSVQSLRPRYTKRVKLKIKKADIRHGVIVQTRRLYRIKSGFGLNFSHNRVALVSNSLKPLGTRISVVLPKKLRSAKWAKLASMGRGTL